MTVDPNSAEPVADSEEQLEEGILVEEDEEPNYEMDDQEAEVDESVEIDTSDLDEVINYLNQSGVIKDKSSFLEDFDGEMGPSELEYKQIYEEEQSDLRNAKDDDDGLKYDDSVKIYLKEIGSIPLLTVEEEIALAKRIEKFDKVAQATLIKANLRLVVSVAKKVHQARTPFSGLDSGRQPRLDPCG